MVTEGFEGIGDVGFNGAPGNIQFLCNFIIGETFSPAQGENIFALGRERFHDLKNPVFQFRFPNPGLHILTHFLFSAIVLQMHFPGLILFNLVQASVPH